MGSFWGSHQYNSSLETSKHTAIFYSRWIGRLWRSDLFKDNTSCSGWNPEFWCSWLRAIRLCWGPGEPRWALGRGYCCSCFCPWNWAEAGPFLPILSDLPFLRASGWCSTSEPSFAPPFRGVLSNHAHLVSTVTPRLSLLPGAIPFNTRYSGGKPHESIDFPLKKQKNQVPMVS